MVKERDISIDVAKGITILLVVYGHLQSPINALIYSFHMPAFFFMSGIFAKKMSLKDTIIKKSHRLLIPFLIYYIYMVVMKVGRLALAGKLNVESFSLLNEKSIFYSIGPIWFLVALFYIFVFYSFISKRKFFIQWIAAIALSILPFLFPEKNPLYVGSSLLGFIFFFMGKCYFNIRGVFAKKIKSIYLFLMVFVGISFLTLFAPEKNAISFNQIDANYFQFISCGFIGTLCVLCIPILLVRWTGIISTMFSKIGTMSLHIMSLHMPLLVYVFNAIALVGRCFTSENLFENYIVNFCVFIIVSGLSYYIGRWVQKCLFDKLHI